MHNAQRIGLCEVLEFEKRQAQTAADFYSNVDCLFCCQIYNVLPQTEVEKPTNVQILFRQAKIAQNPMLAVVFIV